MGRMPEAAWVEPMHRDGNRQSFRYRKMQTLDGVEVRALATRYSYAEGRFIRNDGPHGGKRLHTFPRQAYYLDGRFFRISRAPREDGSWAVWLAPLTGNLIDVYPCQSEDEGIPCVSISVRDGYPVSMSGDMSWSADFGHFADGIAPWLKLDRKPRKRTERSAA